MAATVRAHRQIRDQSHHPLGTDVWAYLNIKNPLCAWAAYRGSLLTPPRYGGFCSVWTASSLGKKNAISWEIELVLERCRARHFPFHISRLKGMFCFAELGDAEKALGTARGFTAANLAELSTFRARRSSGPYDSSWIDYASKLPLEALRASDWSARYWRGEKCHDKPIWEMLYLGELIVLGTDLRERAYEMIKAYFPDSLGLLETGRIAAWVGSSLCNVSAILTATSATQIQCNYWIDMRDSSNEHFLETFRRLRASGHPIRYEAIQPCVERGAFGPLPDLTRMDFRFDANVAEVADLLPIRRGYDLYTSLGGTFGPR